MGLMIHSLGELPTTAERGYYVYLLDYGWHEPLSDAVYQNFDKMADLASRNNAVVMRGVVGSHFADEVLSWHHVDGQPADDLLPAILITTRHPLEFRDQEHSKMSATEEDYRLLIIPLRSVCKSTSDVVELINKLFRDIRDKKVLGDFIIARELKKGREGALVDALILEPNFSGIGLDIKKIIRFFRGSGS